MKYKENVEIASLPAADQRNSVTELMGLWITSLVQRDKQYRDPLIENCSVSFILQGHREKRLQEKLVVSVSFDFLSFFLPPDQTTQQKPQKKSR